MSGPRGTPQPGTVKDCLQKLMGSDLNQDAIVGKVTARQFLSPAGWALPDREPYGFWCDVQPEKEGEEELQHVPMGFRVMNYADDLGFILVPKADTEVLVSWVDGRPTIEACQEWERLILKKGEAFYVIVDAMNNVEAQTSGEVNVTVLKSSTETVAIQKHIKSPKILLGPAGLEQAVKGNTWLGIFTSHIHVVSPAVTPLGLVSGPPLNAPAAAAALSLIVKLD